MSYRPKKNGGGTPAWFVFLVVVALVLGGYYLWVGFASYMDSGGLGILEATQRAQNISTATAQRVIQRQANGPTLRPTSTPIPDCQDFVVSVRSAIVRSQPSTNSSIAGTYDSGDTVCVIDRINRGEWYLIDTNTVTRRVEAGYMHEDIIRPLNPTSTASKTYTPLPTVTAQPTRPPTNTLPPQPTRSSEQNQTATLPPSVTPTPTEPIVNV